MISKTMIKNIAFSLLALAAINNVGALEPVKKFVNGDTGFFS